jgi:hypothetical protein
MKLLVSKKAWFAFRNCAAGAGESLWSTAALARHCARRNVGNRPYMWPGNLKHEKCIRVDKGRETLWLHSGSGAATPHTTKHEQEWFVGSLGCMNVEACCQVLEVIRALTISTFVCLLYCVASIRAATYETVDDDAVEQAMLKFVVCFGT